MDDDIKDKMDEYVSKERKRVLRKGERGNGNGKGYDPEDQSKLLEKCFEMFWPLHISLNIVYHVALKLVPKEQLVSSVF